MAGDELAILVWAGTGVIAGIEEGGHHGVDVAAVGEGHRAAAFADSDGEVAVDAQMRRAEGGQRVAADADGAVGMAEGALSGGEGVSADSEQTGLVADEGR